MKNFILILFALLMLVGGVYCKGVSADTLTPKCDYYTDNITKLSTEKYEQDVTGTVCASQDKKSFIQIKNGLAHGNSKLYYKSGALQVEGNYSKMVNQKELENYTMKAELYKKNSISKTVNQKELKNNTLKVEFYKQK